MVAVTSPKAVAKTAPPTVGSLIDQYWALREDKKRHEAAVDEVSKKLTALEAQLVERMKADGLDKAAGKKASVSFTYSCVGDVQGDDGWDKFYSFIKKNNYFHLLQRRVSDAAYKELLASINGAGADFDVLKAKKQIPGVLPFLRRRINVRTVS
jgi:hypothetical protein